MADRLDRLEASWRAARGDTAQAVALARALARRGRRASAHAVLVEALRAGAAVAPVAEAMSRLELGRWSGLSGAWPLRTWSGEAPRSAPQVAWDEHVVRADLRYGRPCVAGPVLGLIARSTVVGGRFVELIARDLSDGHVLWRHERQNIIAPAPMFALEVDGRGPALGFAHACLLTRGDGAPAASDGAVLDDDHDDDVVGVELVVEVFDAATGTELARHVHALPQAQVVSDESGPVPLAGGDLGWAVSWLDETTRHDEVFLIDGASGALQVAPASSASAAPFWSPQSPPVPARSLSWLCGSLHGVRYAALEAAAGAWQLARFDERGGWRVLGELGPREVAGVSGSAVSACWMGGTLVIAMAHGRQTLLWARDGEDGSALWEVALDGFFHTVPVPVPRGVVALGGERVVALYQP